MTLGQKTHWIAKTKPMNQQRVKSLIIISGPRYWGLLDYIVYSMLAGERVLANEWANGCWWFFVKSQGFVNIYGMLYIMISWNMVGKTHPPNTNNMDQHNANTRLWIMNRCKQTSTKINKSTVKQSSRCSSNCKFKAPVSKCFHLYIYNYIL